MHVRGFMIPADKVATCEPTDTIKTAVDAMVKKHIGALVVMDFNRENATPVGIVTKSDFVHAYLEGLTLDHAVEETMSRALLFVNDTDSRDNAAKALEQNKIHHALVVDSNQKYVGLVSSWDLTAECARDDRAWPWIRADDGRFHNPMPKPEVRSSSPVSTIEVNPNRNTHTIIDYIDAMAL